MPGSPKATDLVVGDQVILFACTTQSKKAVRARVQDPECCPPPPLLAFVG